MIRSTKWGLTRLRIIRVSPRPRVGREPSFLLARSPHACVLCQRRNTLLLRYSPRTWACWRTTCRRAARDFLRYV